MLIPRYNIKNNTLRNEFYGGEFSSHCLSNLLNWADNLKQQPQQTDTSQTNVEAASSTAEKQPTNDAESIESVKCNNNLNRYYSDIEYSFDERYVPTSIFSANSPIFDFYINSITKKQKN